MRFAEIFGGFVIFLFTLIGGGMAADTPLLTVEIAGEMVSPSPGSVTGTYFFSRLDGTESPQILLLGFAQSGMAGGTPWYRLVAELRPGESFTIRLPEGVHETAWETFDTGGVACISETIGGSETVFGDGRQRQRFTAGDEGCVLRLETTQMVLEPERRPASSAPHPDTPALRPAIADALIEWDWRMQDGIGTPLEPRSYRDALVKIFTRGDSLLESLRELPTTTQHRASWEQLRDRFRMLDADIVVTGSGETRSATGATMTPAWESLWMDAHQLRREIVLSNPLFADVGPILFTKHIPSVMSHQLTQCYGYTARPGGGLFVLKQPGHSMAIRNITPPSLPSGNFMQTDISPTLPGGVSDDAFSRRILFAFVASETSPDAWRVPESVMSRRYHIYEMEADGSGMRQLTDGDFDDFSPLYTPDPDGSRITFISTRRGGFHRCGGGPCYVYTLAQMDRDGGNVEVKSFHETNEWDPAVLDNGRIVYTRWDYVDRNAVFYQNLWSTRPDGTDTRIFFGNNTFNPAGIWQSQAVPGSAKVMAIAGPHHALSAGSVILVDPSRGVDGPEPIERLTPDALFPETEEPLAVSVMPPPMTEFDSPPLGWWDGSRPPGPVQRVTFTPEEQRRWPGHCYTTPWPLSEVFFIVSYSYDRLRGEAGPNIPNMFGIFFADRFGNRELVYRDPMITSQWAKPLNRGAREIFENPPASSLDAVLAAENHGTLFMRNVYESWPQMPNAPDADPITRLRIVQVLPKTTPNANQPMVGAAFASPGKQVLGTVPVEADGSAYFMLPAGIPVSFVALNSRGRAAQVMRSVHYVQPGETGSCIGCHESRTAAPDMVSGPGGTLAERHPPSPITSGPDGSKPFSYPILVQPVLDAKCVKCHCTDPQSDTDFTNPGGGVILTGEPDGAFTRSYNALAGLGAYSAWEMPGGNGEPLSIPGRFASGGSPLVKLLDIGHHDVQLTNDEWERLCTWLDANSLFYGTFNSADQARQQRGERIDGPDLE